MKELYVFCEGKTEQGFCNQVLAPHLFPAHDGRIYTRLISNKGHGDRASRGGVGKFAPLRYDILCETRAQARPDVRFTTMIDLYKFPADFPGRVEHAPESHAIMAYVESLEETFGVEIGDRRFLPYIQLFEYETLLFADPEAFRCSFDDCDAAVDALKEVAEVVDSIEHINDGPTTAPSKRIISLLPKYARLKTTAGPDIAEYIGMPTLRSKSPHFDRWVARLESAWEGEP